MDQLKSNNRLSQYTDLITDMVSYTDIQSYLLEDNTITLELHTTYLGRIKQEKRNNSTIMAEVVAAVRKRKGGFERFVEILRRTDYIWLAEQLDPTCEFTESQKKRNSIDSFVSTVARKSFSSFGRRKSRNTTASNEDMIETVYTTYRDSYTSDIAEESNKRSSYGAVIEKDRLASTSSSDVDIGTKSRNNSIDIDETLNQMSIEDNPDANSKRNSVLLYNLPESNSHFMDHIMDTRQFEKVAKTLGLSSKILSGLKVIRVGRIGKIKSKGNGKQKGVIRPLKARFKTEEGCQLFLQSIEPHGGVISTEFGDITVEPCDSSTFTNPKEKVKKKYWYQKRIFGRRKSTS